ncbi:DUF6144 family protein [Cloacibacillus porcorum]|uniref:L-2-amino-thiazoline-4-carboxylic acid hydrolase n=1 Tax=Cloacibacillus porcorum TaxID=1197717 RepID=A0A1B2I5I6_9BACT|nr:DUF6144 family protein [Cloacibacillus porcorum]ANZ45232.1 hypothetical protein BED41_09215 [Cloacibacillus porcorum]
MRHPEVDKLLCSLTENGYDSLAKEIEQEMGLPLEADAKQRENWMRCTLNKLDANMNDEAVKKVRKGCVCSLKKEVRIPGYKEVYERTKSRKEQYRKLYLTASSLDEFVAELKKLEDKPGKPSVELINGKIYKYFYSCTCPFLNDISPVVPKAWCYCTLGNSEDTFSYALGREVHGNLIESIKMGDSRCTIEIEV